MLSSFSRWPALILIVVLTLSVGLRPSIAEASPPSHEAPMAFLDATPDVQAFVAVDVAIDPPLHGAVVALTNTEVSARINVPVDLGLRPTEVPEPVETLPPNAKRTAHRSREVDRWCPLNVVNVERISAPPNAVT